MSIFDNARNVLLQSQEDIFSDNIFFQNNDGDFTIAHKGIFKSESVVFDSVTQQDVVSNEPVLWIQSNLPEGVEAVEGILIKLNDRFYKVKDVRNDLDQSCMFLYLYEVKEPKVEAG